MDNLLGVVIVLILLAAILVPFLSVLFSRRYPREQENSSRRKPPTG
jgi:hypothetical protein